MSEEIQEPQEVQVLDQVIEQVQEEQNSNVEQISEPEPKETQVPLSALQKERKKRQELEYEYQRLQQEQMHLQQKQHAQEEDESDYESVTKKDLRQTQQELMRDVEERLWVKQNPERFEYINENLQNFLKQRPNLTSAISQSPNRYEEAYLLMSALSPKQQQQMKAAPVKKEAPNSPASVPKGAALNQAVDIMSMSDTEFSAWRSAQKRR